MQITSQDSNCSNELVSLDDRHWSCWTEFSKTSKKSMILAGHREYHGKSAVCCPRWERFHIFRGSTFPDVNMFRGYKCLVFISVPNTHLFTNANIYFDIKWRETRSETRDGTIYRRYIGKPEILALFPSFLSYRYRIMTKIEVYYHTVIVSWRNWSKLLYCYRIMKKLK